MLAVVACAYVLSFFHRFAPAGIAQDLAMAFETSAASLGVLAATYFYIYTLMQVPTGILVDTVGPRRVLFAGAVVAALGAWLFALAPSLGGALAGRTLIGLGVSVTFVSMLKLIAVWFDERHFATLVGACMLIGNLGSILAGAPLAALAAGVGWRGVFVGAGVLSLLLGLGCWWLVRDSPVAPVERRAMFDRTAVMRAMGKVLRNRKTWPAALANTGIAGAFFAFGGLWAMPYLMQAYGLSRNVAASHLSLYFGGFALGCVCIGWLSDRIGRRKPVLLLAAHLNVVIWLIWLSGIMLPLWLSYTLFAIMGFSTAGFTLTWACAKEVNPPLLSGMSTSVTNMGGFLAGALLQPAVGWVMDLGWRGTMLAGSRFYEADLWRNGLMLIALTAFLGAASTWWVKETGCRNVCDMAENQ